MNNPQKSDFAELNKLSSGAVSAASLLQKGADISTSRALSIAARKMNFIEKTRQKISSGISAGVTLPKAYEWLLDNWYIAEREGKSACHDIKSAGVIPRLKSEKHRPFVFECAKTLILSGGCAVDEERLRVFLDSFQSVILLSETELSVFIPAVKLELLSVLSDNCRVLNMDESENEDISELFSAIFTSLRFLSGFDALTLLESVNRLEGILRTDPSGMYSDMDESARMSYRNEITRLARLNDISEHDAAQYAIELSKPHEHVGHYIFTKPLGSEKKQSKGGVYIGFILLTSLFFTLLIGFYLDIPAVSILLLLPISEIIKSVADSLVLRFTGLKRVFRLELQNGVPDNGKTLCAVSVLLSAGNAENFAEMLEEYRISNRDAGGKNLLFALLADLPESKTAAYPEDAAHIESVSEKIRQLNEKYGGGFYLLYRKRVKNPRDGGYRGWERKRGAILELCRFLRGKSSGIICAAGDNSVLTQRDIKYVICLDSDTRLSAGSARELVGAAMHPLNRPVIDKKRGIVITGSGIIQPRVSVSLSSFSVSDFSLFFTGQGGIDPYGGTASDLYQSMIGAGSFTGKGIIDVDAYLSCLNTRFPENKVLSHDLLEGAFLRCAFAGDIELTDGFPATVKSFYSRMHRWIRGDWQSVPWLFRYTENAKGKRIHNPLRQIDKWKIIDNLRRSLVPPFLLAALITSLLYAAPAFLVVLLTTGIVLMTEIIISGITEIFASYQGRVRFVSKIINGFSAQIIRSFLKLMLLPFEAWVCLHAVCTAIYRMCITKKRLLEWTTAAESERRGKDSVLSYYTRMWACPACAVITAAFTPYAPAWALAIIWALTPLYARSIGKVKKTPRKISTENRLFLARCAGDGWRYFEDMLTPEDNFLPPDNFQEQPSVGIAHRTSPTNIGLCLISALAAIDIGVCSRESAINLISRTLDTVSRLPKWRGHLYNWYDTSTLRVLNPAYVSTVDSGNFAGCLIALESGLIEHGEEGLAQTVRNMLLEMSFAPLFDEKRQLFYIGWDIPKNKPSGSWYDLMASEAMLTSFYSIARGDVPRKHWRRLSRALVGLDGFRGMVSWTGTMFEYLMPGLLLPCYRDSFIYESVKFCLLAQRKTCRAHPWGTSESAYYDFDHTLSYRYKAHGVQKLALKRGMERDDVISPYSAFLALGVNLEASVANLRRMQKMGAEGRYGFYEAIDYTPSRTGGRDFEIVKTYMAHHVGMSLVSIDNVLNGNIMQKRFMRDREMSAFAELLQEKVPVGGVVLSQIPRDVPDKPMRAQNTIWRFESDFIETALPRCCPVSNGSYVVTIAETGQSMSVWNGITMTRASFDPAGTETGIAFFLWSGDEIYPLLPSPVFDKNISYGVEMSGGVCRITSKTGAVSASVSVTVPEKDAGELRTVEISSSVHREAELICCFEPVLSSVSDYDSHPAFSKMSLETSFDNDVIFIRRRPRVKGHGLVLAFGCDTPFSYDTSREISLGRGGIASIKTALQRKPSETVGAVLDPFIIARVKLKLEPDTTARVKFALAPSYNNNDAFDAVSRILDKGESAAAPRLDVVSSHLGLTPEQTGAALSLLSEIVYPSPFRRVPDNLTGALSLGQSSLWSLGISGDYPILSVNITSDGNMRAADEIIDAHTLLSECGAGFDLAFILHDGGDYRGALKSGLSDILRKKGLECKLGARRGIHAVNFDSEGCGTLLAVSFRVLDGGEKLSPENRRGEYAKPESLIMYGAVLSGTPEYRYNNDNSFTFVTGDSMPQNSWSHMLSNGGFGYIASDAGIGHMWHNNARENKINRWLNDSLEVMGTERLQINRSGEKISLFSAPDGYTCNVTYGFGYASWEKNLGDLKTKVTAFVPPDADCRIFIIETDAPDNAEIHYFTDLVLGADNASSIYVMTKRNDGVIYARNTYSADFQDTVFKHISSTPETAFTCHKENYRTGVLEGITGCGFMPCIAAVYRMKNTLVLVSGCADDNLLKNLSKPDNARRKLQETINHWRNITETFTVKTPNELLNRYLNGWALYQTYACRVLGRSSLYQSGGAYGYRDQLQDVCALITSVPEEAYKQIIRAAQHQYEEGDVQHWWHPGTRKGEYGDRGVRTKCSDDLLWLAYTLCEYTEKTGDFSICSTGVTYLSSALLSEDEHERYEQPLISKKTESVLTHASRALDLVLSRGTGRHGLCLIGGGDWNDGMNLVGAGGEGESVWLTWFVIHTAERFAVLCEAQENTQAAERYRNALLPLRRSAENAWDGKWYLRGYFDDGTPLGSSDSDECRIDSIAQSFASLGGTDSERVRAAIENAVDILFRREERVIMLFDPPFSSGRVSPGYIKGYSPGFRENGGQYTHGAIWLAMSLLITGMTDKGLELLDAILPGGRNDAVYRTEPYVLAADVYSNERHLGRGGWTWYTGASGWFMRVAMENLLGIRLIDGVLHINPVLPEDWNGFEVIWKNDGNEYLIKVDSDGEVNVTQDGKRPANNAPIALPGSLLII